MAFFSAVSSSIGKKLLLYGLRHIDILDKDPADFVNVDVGKRTTLEVRDVGLHIKKLVALLHLKLPPEIHLSKAKASLLRVTFVLDFGVPQIIIEINGIQVHAKLAEDPETSGAKPRGKGPSPKTRTAARRRAGSPGSRTPHSDDDSDEDDEHVPTVDELAKSFMREEPDEEIRELEQELNTHSEYLQDSVSSSDDGDDLSAGMGAPLGLPTYLRNVLNTALDRMQISINHIDIEVEDQFPADPSGVAREDGDPFVSLNFHIERIAMDSVTARDARLDIQSSHNPAVDPSTRLGQRRMRVENICARLISDADNFVTTSRMSRPLSPTDTRSEISSDTRPQSEPSASQASVRSVEKDFASSEIKYASVESSKSDLDDGREADIAASTSVQQLPEPSISVHEEVAEVPVEQNHLASSALTTDDDRFADAASDDGLGRSTMTDSFAQSKHSLPNRDLNSSSILYDDEGLLDFAMQNDLLGSRVYEDFEEQAYADPTTSQLSERPGSIQDTTNSRHESARSQSGLLTVSALARSTNTLPTASTLARSSNTLPINSPLAQSSDTLPATSPLTQSSNSFPTVSVLARSSSSLPKAPSPSCSEFYERPPVQHEETPETIQSRHTEMADSIGSRRSSSSSSVPAQDDGQVESTLAESQLFTHDDAESMYMSAMSDAPTAASRGPHIPGGWDSASNSSHGTESDSGPIPESMVAGSILGHIPEGDDGCETPRPGSPQSMPSSPLAPRETTPTKRTEEIPMTGDAVEPKMAKTFLTVDQITVWFPLGLTSDEKTEPAGESVIEASAFDFKPPNLGDDSIFQEMPGSFSNYAHSTSSRRQGSAEEAARRRPDLKASQATKSPSTPNHHSADFSVELGSITGHIDFSAGRIMFQMVDRVLKAVTGIPEGESKPNKDHPKQQDQTASSRSKMDLSIRNFGIVWLDHLATEAATEGGFSYANLAPDPLEAILRTNMSSIHLVTQSIQDEVRTKLKIGKFVLSALDHDILTFQTPKTKSRRSLASKPESIANDIEIDFEQSKDPRITIVTRPVGINLDLQRLDDALGTFGGFSGILELGNSITSNNTANSPAVTPVPPRSKGVHFGDTPPPPSNPVATNSSTPKVDVQFGEVSLVVKGRSCAVQLQTTSVRAAVRKSNVRLKVAEVNLSGPHVDGTQMGAPLLVEIRGTTVNFVFTPEEVDLTRLISMITPSKDPYENDQDILIDTLLRQRRKGSVLRAEVASVGVRVSDITQLQTFEILGAEIAKLSKVTKYLPDDDRPGILTLASVQNLSANVMINDRLGDVSVSLGNAAVAHVGVPALLAVEIGTALVKRDDEVLVHEVVELRSQDHLPMIMLRMVGDEMEPIVKAKMFNVCFEYRVSTVMAALGLSDDGTVDDIALGLASSVATITGGSSPKTLSRQSTQSSSPPTQNAKPLQIDLLLRSCAIGLNPRKITSKGLFVLSDAHVLCKQGKTNMGVSVELRKASIHAIDDTSRLSEKHEPLVLSSTSDRHLRELGQSGYVSLSSISAAKVVVSVSGDIKDQPQMVDVEFKNELFVLESCADSTQTLIAILNGLQPPMPPSTAERYRTVVPLQQMMESFTGDAMDAPEDFEDENFMDNADLVADEVPVNLEFVGSVYNAESLPSSEDLGDSMLGEDDLGALATPPITRQRGDRGLLESFQEQYEVAEGEQEFDFSENYFKDSDSDGKGKARKWDSAKNQYSLTNEFKTPNAPLKVRVRDMNVIWNLYDGYDWPRTQNVIAQAVEDVEARAEERRRKPRDEDDDEDFVEQDFLFNSVWIGVPIKDEKGALARRINHDIDDLVSETGSYAPSTATRSTATTARPRSIQKPGRRRLKLERSKNKKVAFQLMGVAVDLVVYPPTSGETQNSVDVRIQDFEIYDHVPSSTWKKFVTCLVEPSQREMSKPMIDLELLTVKPVSELAASELVIRVTVLPLRLHVDQDALDFITRFFEFKDESVLEDSSSPSEQPFIQRLEVNSVTLKLDYKPKRVDYRGLRSGHTTEFMNFLVLEGADIVLRHAIVYGITSFDKLHKTLNDVWMPDVKQNQLPGVLSGLAAVRPLVNVGSGVKDLVVVPMREYKKDGRIVRSLQKGVYAFAKNTTSEVARLGAKVAIGTQTLLEGAETFLNPQQASPGRSSSSAHDWDGEDPSSSDSEEPRAVSNYANQPIGVRAGLQSAARHLERDLLTARDAVIAIPAEIMEEGTGAGMARAIARRAPTVILRPALGATKAVSNALLGVGNALDSESRRKIDDKYKSR